MDHTTSPGMQNDDFSSLGTPENEVSPPSFLDYYDIDQAVDAFEDAGIPKSSEQINRYGKKNKIISTKLPIGKTRKRFYLKSSTHEYIKFLKDQVAIQEVLASAKSEKNHTTSPGINSDSTTSHAMPRHDAPPMQSDDRREQPRQLVVNSDLFDEGQREEKAEELGALRAKVEKATLELNEAKNTNAQLAGEIAGMQRALKPFETLAQDYTRLASEVAGATAKAERLELENTDLKAQVKHLDAPKPKKGFFRRWSA